MKKNSQGRRDDFLSIQAWAKSLRKAVAAYRDLIGSTGTHDAGARADELLRALDAVNDDLTEFVRKLDELNAASPEAIWRHLHRPGVPPLRGEGK